jgi:hypothetical protein
MNFEQVKFPSVHQFDTGHLCSIPSEDIDDELRSLKEQYIVKIYRTESVEIWGTPRNRIIYSFGNTNIFMDTLPYIQDKKITKYHIKFFKGIPDLRAPFQSITPEEAFETLFNKQIPAYHMLDIISSLGGR